MVTLKIDPSPEMTAGELKLGLAVVDEALKAVDARIKYVFSVFLRTFGSRHVFYNPAKFATPVNRKAHVPSRNPNHQYSQLTP